jgi:hypothetical protein
MMMMSFPSRLGRPLAIAHQRAVTDQKPNNLQDIEGLFNMEPGRLDAAVQAAKNASNSSRDYQLEGALSKFKEFLRTLETPVEYDSLEARDITIGLLEAFVNVMPHYIGHYNTAYQYFGKLIAYMESEHATAPIFSQRLQLKKTRDRIHAVYQTAGEKSGGGSIRRLLCHPKMSYP